MMSGFDAIKRIDIWLELGWLSQLNRAFARFLKEQDEQCNDLVIFAAALVSHQLDRGEVYLDLAKLCQSPTSTLAVPDDNNWQSDQKTAPIELATLNQLTLLQWQAALKNSSLVASGSGHTPLVSVENRLYLRRYWEYQQRLHAAIQYRLLPIRDSLPEFLLVQIEELFPVSVEQPDWQKVACVLALRARFSIITGGPGTGKTTTLAKLIALLISLCQHEANNTRPLDIVLAAPTGKAAARVSESIGKALADLNVSDLVKQRIPKQAITLHRFLGSSINTRRFRYHRHNPIIADVVIIDEASMVDLEMMAALLDALPEQCQLILLGDKDQLASVEAGAVLGDLCDGADAVAYNENTRQWLSYYAGVDLSPVEVTGNAINQQTVMLRHSHRFNVQTGIGQLAQAVNVGDVKKARLALSKPAKEEGGRTTLTDVDCLWLNVEAHPDVALKAIKHLVALKAEPVSEQISAQNQGYGYFRDMLRRPRPTDITAYNGWAKQVLKAFDAFQVLCAVRRGVWGTENLNCHIEAWLFPDNHQNLWYEGRPVMISRNDYNQDLMNGDIGIALTDFYGKLRVVFPNTDPRVSADIRWLSPQRLPDADTAFAITVHKAQGSEFNHVALVLPEYRNAVISRELIYTGITRAKQKFTLVESNMDVFDQAVSEVRK